MAERPAWVAQYLPDLIRRGMSATAALNLFRAAPAEGGLGLHVSTSEWYRQFGETLSDLSKREGFVAVNYSLRPTSDQMTTFTSRRATGYLYPWNVLVRNRSTGETYYQVSGYRTERLVSFRVARQGAIDAITQAAAEGSPSVADVEVLGALPLPVREYVPLGEA